MTFGAWLDGTGLPPDARRVVEAVARTATYVDAPDVVSADLVVGMVQRALGPGVRYLHGGWQGMVDALLTPAGRRPLTVRTGPGGRAVHVGRDGDDMVVQLADGSRVVARATVIALASPAATATLLDRRPFDVGPMVEASALDLGVTASVRCGLLLGLDRPLYASDHGAAHGLAPRDGRVVHVLRYLSPGEEPSHTEVAADLDTHAAAAGVRNHQVRVRRFLHRQVVVGGVATAALGGLTGRPPVDAAGIPGVSLVGDWVGPVGHLLDASISSAAAAARAAAARVGPHGSRPTRPISPRAADTLVDR
jgi:phytoene dehydrogenase-like protein